MAKGPEAGEQRPQDQDASRKMRQSRQGSAGMDAELQAHIGRHLKAAYEDILNQPVPDRFNQLLEALDRREAAGSSDEESNDGEAFRS
jgi:hypothetical protein